MAECTYKAGQYTLVLDSEEREALLLSIDQARVVKGDGVQRVNVPDYLGTLRAIKQAISSSTGSS